MDGCEVVGMSRRPDARWPVVDGWMGVWGEVPRVCLFGAREGERERIGAVARLRLAGWLAVGHSAEAGEDCVLWCVGEGERRRVMCGDGRLVLSREKGSRE